MCGSDMKKHIRFFRSSYNNSKLNVVKTYPIVYRFTGSKMIACLFGRYMLSRMESDMITGCWSNRIARNEGLANVWFPTWDK